MDKSAKDIAELMKRLKESGLSQDDVDFFVGCTELATWLPEALRENKISMRNLQRLIFGETRKKKGKKGSKGNKGNRKKADAADSAAAADEGDTSDIQPDEPEKEGVPADSGTEGSGEKNSKENVVDLEKARHEKQKGHGRFAHTAYKDALEYTITHTTLNPGDACPDDCGGKVYPFKPGMVVRITGNTLGTVHKYELEKLRCNLCGTVFTADLPPGVSDTKYDSRFKAILAMQKYYMGVPFNRQASLQGMLGLPSPSSTQFELVEHVADAGYRVVSSLEKIAANAKVIHNDDTKARILSLMYEHGKNPNQDRKGIFTSGIIAKAEDKIIALFYTGKQHAGENLADVLQHRAKEKTPIIQMCDALSANLPKKMETILCKCLGHGFRKIRDLLEFYPEPCLHIIKALGKAFEHDAATVGMMDKQRLAYHRKHSKPILKKLHSWMKRQLNKNRIEPNSSLGKAIKYLLKHWKGLTQFYRIAGCPIDNNIVERALKIPIRIRKSAMFYKTEHGANIANVLLSLIYTAKLANENPVDYLVALQDHKTDVFQNPDDWVPWRYRDTLAALEFKKAA